MASQSISPAERIRELGLINEDVAAMLTAAGRAVNALTDRSVSTTAGNGEDASMVDDGGDSAQMHKDAFEANTESYYTNLQAVMARLRRQAYALEEAGIIAVEPPSLTSSAPRPAASQAPASNRAPGAASQTVAMDAITNGGLGKFDVGWLNSRGNKVGADKEAELVQEAKDLLEKELAKHSND